MGNSNKLPPSNADDEGRATGPNADEANTAEKLEAEARGEVIDPESGGNTDPDKAHAPADDPSPREQAGNDETGNKKASKKD